MAEWWGSTVMSDGVVWLQLLLKWLGYGGRDVKGQGSGNGRPTQGMGCRHEAGEVGLRRWWVGDGALGLGGASNS
ncbi:hypothetical protein L484_022247 [Morus notabilis]|uniref:Uncharacterized protein n=1 Tax=Morus notabilis TaxID=981085 RepID=W9SGL3_9ROSA|nr:hypothetical protein L484_022247 [Morus notabilis]